MKKAKVIVCLFFAISCALFIVIYLGGTLLNYSLLKSNFNLALPYPYRIASSHVADEKGKTLDFDRYFYFTSKQLNNLAEEFYDSWEDNSVVQGRIDYFKQELYNQGDKVDQFIRDRQIDFNEYEYYQLIDNPSGSCAMLLVDVEKQRMDIFHFYVLP